MNFADALKSKANCCLKNKFSSFVFDSVNKLLIDRLNEQGKEMIEDIYEDTKRKKKDTIKQPIFLQLFA